MQIILNGQAQQVPERTNIHQLLHETELIGKRLAVSVNGDLVPRTQHSNVQLNEGDQVEVIQAVGGG